MFVNSFIIYLIGENKLRLNDNGDTKSPLEHQLKAGIIIQDDLRVSLKSYFETIRLVDFELVF